ncbi:MAG: DUF2723 domain-containing protein [Dysgonamonadaceae bacterium]|nr:DUF2723 domain-containing protein [Dysgonamonadaceae bacterium]
MKNYKLVNNIFGWLVFLIAAVVYLMTVEQSASFWDCGEFIASAYKLEVGHPPGNPIFMMVANLFTQLASDTSQVPLMVNCMSAVFSALTILFLFWTITHMVRKITLKDDEALSLGKMIIIIGSGLVGALAYTFSDTFWFSAVEGEVYAFSSLMTALVFWLILKWEDVAGQPHADRWLILIAYLMGLSIAVHLLNLLCIPAIVLVYYFKKKENPTLKGSLFALFVSFGIIVAILYGLVQGLVEVAGLFELLFVNVFGMSYNSGVIVYIILIGGVLAWSIWESMRLKENPLMIKISFILSIVLLGIPFIGNGYWLGILIIALLTAFMFGYKKINVTMLNTILIGLFVITIGYSSYALIMIRSAANTPMDQNSPEDIFTLRTYLSREQYGDTPLIYGETYASEAKRVREGQNFCIPEEIIEGPIWTRVAKKDESEKDSYFISGYKKKYKMVDELNMLFPRMYSKEGRHVAAYKEWANVKGKRITYQDCGEPQMAIVPTFAENLRYFFSYQVNFMYWRYFMWNFSGRQNDIQGNGEVNNGNWITGIKFIDEKLVGPQDDMPDDIANNKGHNKYYMLPLLLGIAGLLFQAYSGKRGIEGFWVIFMLFFMTGLAIVLYLNQPPLQPRERDYAYAGSFYAFAIWIGIGVAGVVKGLNKYCKLSLLPSALAATLLCLIVPTIMATENWDDHDRSNRYVARDFGFNYLTTCAPNAIIFTNGDNDTFPLWYAQEVEGYRTDVRVCNLSYLNTDWYIDQMKRQAYESTPLPITWKRSEYISGKHDAAVVYERTKDSVELATILDWVKSDDTRYKRILPGDRGVLDVIPSAKMAIQIDSAAVMRSGLVKPENAHWIPKEIVLDYGEIPSPYADEAPESAKSMFLKNELMILEILKTMAEEGWTRPVYYAATVPEDLYVRVDDYFSQEGIAYRVVPYNAIAVGEPINTDLMFDNMMNKYKWGNIQDSNVYLDENVIRMSNHFRMLFARLARQMVRENKTGKAEQALDYCQEVIPPTTVPYNSSALGLASAYLDLGKNDKALEVYSIIAERSAKALRWFNRLNPEDFRSARNDILSQLSTLHAVLSDYEPTDPEWTKQYIPLFNEVYGRYQSYTQQAKRPVRASNL